MKGLLYTCLTLQSNRTRYDFPGIFGDKKYMAGSHNPNDEDKDYAAPFDYLHAGIDTEGMTTYVSTRNMTIKAYRIGEGDEEQGKAQLRHTVHNIMAINNDLAEEEQRNSTYLELAHSRVFSKVTGRTFMTINVKSSQSKFIVMTRDVPVYFLVATNNNATYLLWSNEDSLENRIRQRYGEEFYFYRMPVFTDGICVIPSLYLYNRLRTWSSTLGDKLKIMNALEAYLSKRRVTDSRPTVNTVTETDHLSQQSTN